jgi:hypothetical protein
MQLVPYLLAMADDASSSGAPLFRPFALDWPAWEPGWSLVDQYLLGDRIAVAPIVAAGTTERSYQLPAGTWYGLLDGRPVISDGASPLTATAAMTEIPAFVPDCSLLVMYPPELDSVVAAGPGIVDLADVADDREIWMYPCIGLPGRVSILSEPNGLGYVRSGGTLTSSDATWNGSSVSFTISDGWAVAQVSGSGRLVAGGAELLRAQGGRNDRRLTLRIAVP